jgi:hypothetical protein
LFWGNGIAIFAAIYIVALKVPETKPTQQQIDATIGSGSTEEAYKGNLLQALSSRPFLIIFTMITTWYGFVYAQHRFALPLRPRNFSALRAAILAHVDAERGAGYFSFVTVMALTRKWKPSTPCLGAFSSHRFRDDRISRNLWLLYLSTLLWTLGES